MPRPSIFTYSENCCKVFLFTFNLVFTASGLFLICLGLWIMLNLNKLGIMNLECLCNLPWMSIVFGLIVMISGCISYIFLKKSFFVFMYGSCLFIMFVFGITLGVLTISFNSRIDDAINKGITYHMENYLSNNKDTVMDRVQTELECCGNAEPNDWLRTSVGQIPPSCCKIKMCDPTKIFEIHETGCHKKLMANIKFYTNELSLAAILGSTISFVGCIISFSYAYQALDNYEQLKEMDTTQLLH